MEGKVATFIDALLTYENLAIVAATWAVLASIRRIFPDVKEHPFYARIEPVLPVVLGLIAVWIPGAVAAGLSVAAKCFLGINLGFISGHGYKIFKQLGLGDDVRIQLKAGGEPPEAP